MRCYLVRHGQTRWNDENRLQGHSDLSLSPLGVEQADQVGRYFAALHTGNGSVEAVYASPLKRSFETAHAIKRHTGLEPTLEPTLMEMHLGAWEGLTPEEIDTQFAGAYHQWREISSQVQIPGAESLEQFRGRVRSAFTQIVTTCREKGAVVIVTHGGVIASLLADCLARPGLLPSRRAGEADYDHVLRRVTLDNAGISALDCRKHPPHILWVNAVAHLLPHHAVSRSPL